MDIGLAERLVVDADLVDQPVEVFAIGLVAADPERLVVVWIAPVAARLPAEVPFPCDPQQIDIVAPKSRIENTRDSEKNLLNTRKHHLLVDEKENFPVGSGRPGDPLNAWELEVLDAELARDDTVAWYRNPSKASADALQVPYEVADKWKPMQPDFIFDRTRTPPTVCFTACWLFASE